MDYEEFLKENNVGSLNTILSATSLRKMNLSQIEIQTCGVRMPGEAKVIRESDESNCGKLIYNELHLCTSHFNQLQNEMIESGKLIWEW